MARKSQPGDVVPAQANSLRLGDDSSYAWPPTTKGYQYRVEASSHLAPRVKPESIPKKASDQHLDVHRDALNARRRHAAMRLLMRRIGMAI